jgi:hypothetical protein
MVSDLITQILNGSVQTPNSQILLQSIILSLAGIQHPDFCFCRLGRRCAAPLKCTATGPIVQSPRVIGLQSISHNGCGSPRLSRLGRLVVRTLVWI